MVQLEVIVRQVETIWTGRVRKGDVIWANEDAARHLLENNICRFFLDDPKPKQEPVEPEDVPVPKSSDGLTDGPSTDLPS